MSFIPPMLAKPFPDDMPIQPHTWAVEEKYDGHRLIVEVRRGRVTAWSRQANERQLPVRIESVLAGLPDCVLDGELYVPGGKASDVKMKVKEHLRVFVAFDILHYSGASVMHNTYDDRRELLLAAVGERVQAFKNDVCVSPSWRIEGRAHLERLKKEVWARGGEGLIVKERSASYRPGDRSTAFLKIKRLESAVMTVIGFKPATGEKVDRGPFARVILRDVFGHEFSIKTKNDDELAKFMDQARSVNWHDVRAKHEGISHAEAKRRNYVGIFNLDDDSVVELVNKYHPAIGRELRIEFQERTKDGAYREPRWDRWEDE